MLSHINRLVQDYENAKTTANISLKPHRSLSYIKSEVPQVGLVKVNTDGNTSCGGIIRGTEGE